MRISKLFLAVSILLISATCLFAQWEKIEAPFDHDNAMLLFKDRFYVAAGTQGVYSASTTNYSWIAMQSGLPLPAEIWDIKVYNNVLYVATEGGGVYCSTNNGQAWTAYNDGLYDTEIYSLAITEDGIYAATGGGNIFFKPHSSNTWQNKGMIFGGEPIWVVKYLNGAIYAGSNNGMIAFSGDKGVTWNDISTFPTTVYTLAFVNDVLYAGTALGILASENLGDSWAIRNTGLKVAPVNSIIEYQKKPIAATNGEGVFFSTNNGNAWAALGDGLADRKVSSLLIAGDYLYAGTEGPGLYRLPVDQIVISEVAAPMLLNPKDEATNVSVKPIFQWSDSKGAVDYHLQICKDNSFENIDFEKDNIQGNVYQLSEPIEENTTYFWRVAANDTEGNKKWSKPFSFTTTVPLVAPIVIYPKNGAVLEEKDPLLQWESVAAAASYTVRLFDDEEISAPIIDTMGLTGTFLHADILEPNTQYFWRVGAIGSDGASQWTELMTFTTGEHLLSVGETVVNAHLNLYPNPAKDFLMLGFDKDTPIESISIFNINGEIVKDIRFSLSNSTSIKLDISNLSIGKYVLKLKVGSNIYTNSFSIVR